MHFRDQYEAWLTRFSDDQDVVSELTGIRDDEKEIEDRFYTELSFGTAGMRGVLGMGINRMNIYNIRRATKGLTNYLIRQGAQESGVVIAYDSREKSDVFARETALVLANSGVKAFLFDALRPVPILSFAVRHLSAAAGVVITASHNPPMYNGYKVYASDGAQLSPEAAAAVTEEIARLNYEDCLPMDEGEAVSRGLLRIIGNKEVDDAYISMIKSLSLRPELFREKGDQLRIVYTPLHGSGNVPVRRMLRELGIVNVAVVAEQEMPDPRFPTVTAPNPEDPAAFALAIPLAEKTGATVVFGTDPDCDRMGVAVRDSAGVFHTLTGNQIGCLLLYHVLSSRKKSGSLPANGAVVKSIVSTELAALIAKDYGVEMFNVLTGFKFIGEKIQQFEESGEYEFLFGFEESYGYLSGTRVRDKDGVNASLLLCEAACVCMAEGITLYDRLQEIYRKYGFFTEKVVSITLPGKDGIDKIRGIMRTLRENPPEKIGDFIVTATRDYKTGLRTCAGVQSPMGLPQSDVLYYELAGGHWLCIRPSGTEPKIKCYINTCAGDQATADRRSDSLRAATDALVSMR